MRVFEHDPDPLTSDMCDELRTAVRSGGIAAAGVPLSLAMHALMHSGSHRLLAGDLLELLARADATVVTPTERSHMRSAFVACSLETFRGGDPLDWSGADSILERVLAAVDESGGRTGSATPEGAKRLTTYVGDAALLLNTMDQRRTIEVVNAGLRQLGPQCASLDPVALASLLQMCTDATRVHYDMSGLNALRETANDLARVWITANSGTNDTADPSLEYRILLSSADIDAQRRALDQMAGTAHASGDDRAWNGVVSCAAWTLHRTTDPTLAALAVDVFAAVPVPPRADQYLGMATSVGDEERGQRWLEMWQDAPGSPAKRLLESRFYLTFGAPDKSLHQAARPLSVWSAFFRDGKGPAAPEPMLVHGLARAAQEARFLCDVHSFSSACSSASPTSDWSATTIVVVPNHLIFATQLPVAAIERARRNGAEIVSMVSGMYPHSESLSDAALVLRDRIVPGQYHDRRRPSMELSDEWDIDADARRFVFRGTNWYAGTHNSAGIKFRRFTLDFSDPMVNAHVVRQLLMVEAVHAVFDDVWPNLDPARHYVFAIVGIQASLGSVIRTIVTASGRSNVRVIHVANGFEAFEPSLEYDEVSGNALARYHSVADLTDRPDTPLGFRPARQDVRSRLLRREHTYRRMNATLDEFVSKVDGRAERARSIARTGTGRRPRRVLMLGTILPDLSIPHDHGIVHRDIAEWVTHTYDVVTREDSELVVKLHPSECDDKIAFYVTESFADLLPSRDRVTVLPYDAGFHDAVLDVDLTVLWAGTSVLELCLMGAPYVTAGRFANEEYPVASRPQFRSRTEYEELLAGTRRVQIDAAGRLNAIDVIHRITTSPLREYSDQPRRMLLNGLVWPPRIDTSSAARLMADPGIRRLAQRLVASDAADAQQHRHPLRRPWTSLRARLGSVSR